MKAAVYSETGAPSVFRYEDLPDPDCRPGGVIVEIKAIGIQGGDTLNRLGGIMDSMPHAAGHPAPGSKGWCPPLPCLRASRSGAATTSSTD